MRNLNAQRRVTPKGPPSVRSVLDYERHSTTDDVAIDPSFENLQKTGTNLQSRDEIHFCLSESQQILSSPNGPQISANLVTQQIQLMETLVAMEGSVNTDAALLDDIISNQMSLGRLLISQVGDLDVFAESVLAFCCTSDVLIHYMDSDKLQDLTRIVLVVALSQRMDVPKNDNIPSDPKSQSPLLKVRRRKLHQAHPSTLASSMCAFWRKHACQPGEDVKARVVALNVLKRFLTKGGDKCKFFVESSDLVQVVLRDLKLCVAERDVQSGVVWFQLMQAYLLAAEGEPNLVEDFFAIIPCGLEFAAMVLCSQETIGDNFIESVLRTLETLFQRFLAWTQVATTTIIKLTNTTLVDMLLQIIDTAQSNQACCLALACLVSVASWPSASTVLKLTSHQFSSSVLKPLIPIGIDFVVDTSLKCDGLLVILANTFTVLEQQFELRGVQLIEKLTKMVGDASAEHRPNPSHDDDKLTKVAEAAIVDAVSSNTAMEIHVGMSLIAALLGFLTEGQPQEFLKVAKLIEQTGIPVRASDKLLDSLRLSLLFHDRAGALKFSTLMLFHRVMRAIKANAEAVLGVCGLPPSTPVDDIGNSNSPNVSGASDSSGVQWPMDSATGRDPFSVDSPPMHSYSVTPDLTDVQMSPDKPSNKIGVSLPFSAGSSGSVKSVARGSPFQRAMLVERFHESPDNQHKPPATAFSETPTRKKVRQLPTQDSIAQLLRRRRAFASPECDNAPNPFKLPTL